jgi:hypothetical protein
MTAGDTVFTNLVFLSKDKDVNIIDVDGLDLGPLYRNGNISPRNIGDKTYVSTHGIKVSATILVKWRYSDAKSGGKIMEAVISRDKHGIPTGISNDGDSLVLVFSRGSWSAQYCKNNLSALQNTSIQD